MQWIDTEAQGRSNTHAAARALRVADELGAGKCKACGGHAALHQSTQPRTGELLEVLGAGDLLQDADHLARLRQDREEGRVDAVAATARGPSGTDALGRWPQNDRVQNVHNDCVHIVCRIYRMVAAYVRRFKNDAGRWQQKISQN